MDIIDFAQQLNDLIEENLYLKSRVAHLESELDIWKGHAQDQLRQSENFVCDIFHKILENKIDFPNKPD